MQRPYSTVQNDCSFLIHGVKRRIAQIDWWRQRDTHLGIDAIRRPSAPHAALIAAREFVDVSRDAERTAGAGILQPVHRPLRYRRDGEGWQIHASGPRSDPPHWR